MGGRGAPRRAAQPEVAEGGPAREPRPRLEVSPRPKPPARPEADPCGSRPAPEGAGAGAEQSHAAGAGAWCRHCHTKLVELKRQAWKLVSGPGTPLRDPCLSALLLDKLPAPGVPPACRPGAESRCDVCAAHLHPLTREALHLLQAPAGPDAPRGGGGPGTTAGPKDAPGPGGPAGRQPDRRKGPAWPPGPSVQVSVAPAGLGGALSTVTIQAQQCLEGVWGLTRVNSFLPPTCLAEAAVAAVAVADTVRDGAPGAGLDGVPTPWSRGAACASALGTPGPSAGGSTASTAASFFIRAAQKLSLAPKRKKTPPPPAPAARGTCAYPTDFSGVLQLWPPPAPPCLLRAAKAKDNPGGFGKVKVMLRIWPAQGAQRAAESTSFLKVDSRRKQVALYDPAAGPLGGAGLRRPATTAVPKMFAFDAVFPQDSEQAEVCSGTVADVLQSVVSGVDGCIFSFGHRSLGKSYTMIGKDSSPQSLGVVPCAISWLFRLIAERRDRTGARFSVRVSAVEVCGRDQSLRDLLAGVAADGLQDAQSPGVYLQEDPAWGAQLQSQSELRAPTAEKAAFYLDAALAARSPGPVGGEDARRSSHLLFTLHVYQYRVDKGGQGGMSGGRSRLHLIDLGGCEAAPSRGPEATGGSLCLSLSALGSVILALVNGAKHVPYRDHRLTMLLREPLAAAGCRTTMIAHVSDAPAHHAETLSTVQLAARIQRLRRKKAKYASSSSGGESSCEESRGRRPPHLRPFHPRAATPDRRRVPPGLPGDPDYSSSSEQSCDTVIYVGPGGAALSDRELTDSEGPPDFVPIIPALSRRRPSQGPGEADHFRCSTFAELQERLECIDGSEGLPEDPGGAEGAPPSPARGAASPRRPGGPPTASSAPRGGQGADASGSAPEPSKPGTQGDPAADPGARPEPPAPDKPAGGGGRRPLPGPAPPLEPGGGGVGSPARRGPVGGSAQPLPAPGRACPCPAAPARRGEPGLLTATVTVQQPVELNGEDELVFTVVEELPLGPRAARPASLASLGSDCSLQAQASGSRPVSIISSLNDAFDAYTARGPEGAGAPGRSPDGAASLGSWLSEVEVCAALGHGPAPRPPLRPDATAVVAGPSPPPASGRSLGASDPGPPPRGAATAAPAPPGREPWARVLQAPALAPTIHSSLPRKPRTTSAASRPGCAPPSPRGPFEDPWLLRADDCDAAPVACGPVPGSPRLPGAPRVVDGCELAGRAARRPEAVARIPPLRRGATTLGVTTVPGSCGDAPAEGAGGPRASPGLRKGSAPKGGFLPRPPGAGPPAPPVRKSSLEQSGLGAPRAGPAAPAPHGEEEARPGGRGDPPAPRGTSSLRARAGKGEPAPRPAGASLERGEGQAHGSKGRDGPARGPRAVPRLGVPAGPVPEPPAAGRGGAAKAGAPPKPPAAGAKGRSLVAGGSRAPGAPVSGRAAAGAAVAASPRTAPRAAPAVGCKTGRGTVMGAKQALRAAHSRVHELAAGGGPGRGGPAWGSADSDSGLDSGAAAAEERPPAGPALPSPYSKVTAPRRPQRYSSGHGSDNSSVLSGELPPAMGRTVLFYHSGGSSGYESVLRDSEEATGSASSAPDSTSESGAASPGARARSLKSPKKRATGLQRRRLIPAPLPDAAALARKPSLPGQWVDLPPPLAGALKEPFEIKVYEIDDVERLQRHRPPPREPAAQASQDVEKGPVCVPRLRGAERRQQRLREVQARRPHLCEELAETQGRLMLEPGRWLEQFEVDPELEPESPEYLAALERATAALEQCVNLCKAHVMMVTCFDIGATAAAARPGPQEVDV
ncbi:LOW QUALITY PROTEIN: kinesin-like protein KIF26A [Perognathus longimembris pacificus]|uniref:LOW QUALITY PROTEIN: kinesin-like protein KIF26A n=1 Tax=Perognathus longimembris pacificus TaxID=214514 RepID=UPI00201A10E0|nr:LOW QUALITY PROTEIN: kinesin-like protein KIF26A [Perognathus longimembris pacificus]